MTPEEQRRQDFLDKLMGGSATPQRGTWTDPTSGAIWAWEVNNGVATQTQVKAGAMGPAYKPDLQVVQTSRGKVVQDMNALKSGDVIPGTETPAAAPPKPDVNTTTRTIPWLNPATNQWEDKPNANYVPPRDPVADAIASRAPVTTPEQLKANAIAQGEALDQLNAARLARGEILGPADEAALKSKYDMIAAEYTAAVNKLTADTAWARGEQGRADAAALAKSTDARAQAADTRAAQQQKVQQAQVQADAYNQQATEGQGMLGQGIKLGVAPSAEAVQQMYFDPHKRALDVLAQAMAGPEFDPNARALSLIGQQMQPAQAPYTPLSMPAAPTITPVQGVTTQATPTITYPRAPMLGGPRAPMPYQ